MAKWFTHQFRVSSFNCFADLEASIAALPLERERGNAFEVFAEAWLATQRIPQARDVWPCNTAAPSLQESLRLPISDKGVDGLFESAGDEPTCYQVKFRTGRPRLSWTELSTFFGLADANCGRLVFTNCDEIARVAENRPGVVFVRGGDLDRLTQDDFQVMGDWLAGAEVVRKTKSPRPHQEAAIRDILATFEHHSRATALMACATGKTLVALWVAGRLGARNVLVLLPSLALVRQTLHEWLHETNWPEWEYRCVCSDPTVLPEEDALVVRQSDLDFKVTTKSASVRSFLERPTNAVRIVFSTYQSSAVVAEAAAGLAPFDFGVFDEAHKTAGLDGMKQSLALSDEQLPITRRLFLTATPRHYKLASKDKAGAQRVVFSMDAPDVYGVVAHRLPFSAAAKANIITNYKVVISKVTSEEVTAEALRRGVVLVKGDKVKARQVANQIALQAAIARYGVRKIFTFHGRVASAASFVSSGPEGIATHLPDFHCDHISGAMPTGMRERRMREFESKQRAVMSNARCLTEGVDVPAVDMVAFLSPRRSLVDIVQAAGRAMRRAEGKEFGYVFVPLYVEEARGETNLEAVKRGNYDEIWNILNRLQEHDDLLAQIINDMRVQRGETGGFDDARFRERVEIMGPALSLDELRRSITAACLDALGDPWMERYGQLTAYFKKHGNCEIPARHSENKALATWVVAQRYERKSRALTGDRIALLDRIGFTWDPYSAEWRGNYLSLQAFRQKHGHCDVVSNSKEFPKLGRWVKMQRAQRKRGRLSLDRIELLNRLGFDWQARISTWEARFAELIEYQNQVGHTRVPVKWKDNPELGQWVVAQRYKHRQKKLRQEYESRLDAIGFEWDVLPDQWELWSANIEKLRNFKQANGHVLVSATLGHDVILSRWVTNLRRLKRKGKLPDDKVAALDELGMTWDAAVTIRSSQWEEKYRQLKSRYEASGTCEPARGASDRPSRLQRTWMNDQRQLKRSGKLASDRVARLEQLRFRWTPRAVSAIAQLAVIAGEPRPAQSWEEMYRELTEFFRKNGHCDVSETWVGGPQLAHWVFRQRELRAGGRLEAEREKKLNELGFSWVIFDARWDQRFMALTSWIEATRRGRKRVLTPELARWSQTQRQHRRLGILPPEREARLDGAGFQWAPYRDQWSQMLDALDEFKRGHGHCRVPSNWSRNPQLARWVGVQRARKSKGTIRPERETALDSLGFSWVVGHTGRRMQTDAWGTMFSRLTAFHAAYGHAKVPQLYPADTKLGLWVTTQRRKKRSGKLTASQIEKLDKLGFVWSFSSNSHPEVAGGITPFGQRCSAMLAVLHDFHEAHGHCRVPTAWAKNRRLANWVSVQRRRKKKNELQADRVTQLDALGFDWVVAPEESSTAPRSMAGITAPARDLWPDMFPQLVAYKDSHGDCRVPQRWRKNRRLAEWVSGLRELRKKRRLDHDRERILDELGFDWDPISTRWETMFAQLVEYKRSFGDTHVRATPKKYSKLANWVRMQRRDKKIGRPIGATRLHRLDELGFVWRFVEPTNWEKMFSTLVEFKKRHGHCNVPQRHVENIRFGRWVNTQRQRFKNNKLPIEKRRQLDELGFVWNTKPSANT